MSSLGPGLTIGLGLFTGQAPSSGSPPTLAQLPELARTAEAAGFDAFWVSEHHGFEDGYLPAPLLGLAAAASVTSTIALGTGLAIAPLHHPVRLAEDAAVLQWLSRGRLLLGLGIGYAAHEFSMYGVPRQARGKKLEELVTFLRAVWDGNQAVPPGGDHPISVTPRLHPSHPIPIWLGGYAARAIERSGRSAQGHLIGRGDDEVVHHTLMGLRGSLGPGPRDFTIAVNFTTVLDGPGLEADQAVQGFARNQATYDAVQSNDDPYGGLVPASPWDADDASTRATIHLIGTADEVVDQCLARLQPFLDFSDVHVVLRALHPDTDLERQRRRVLALGDHVLPELRRRFAGAPS